MTTSIERFERTLRNLEGVYRRLDSGQLTGRNSTSTDETIDAHFGTLRGLLAAELHDNASPLFAHLDTHPRLAARWDRIERRYVGLPA